MNIENINKIKELYQFAEEIESLSEKFQNFLKNEQISNSTFSFSVTPESEAPFGSVFSSFLSLEVYATYHKNGSTEVFSSLDSKLASSLLDKVLNNNLEEILKEMGAEARKEAETLKTDVKKELTEISKLIGLEVSQPEPDVEIPEIPEEIPEEQPPSPEVEPEPTPEIEVPEVPPTPEEEVSEPEPEPEPEVEEGSEPLEPEFPEKEENLEESLKDEEKNPSPEDTKFREE